MFEKLIIFMTPEVSLPLSKQPTTEASTCISGIDWAD
jgi:hypothetical protein